MADNKQMVKQQEATLEIIKGKIDEHDFNILGKRIYGQKFIKVFMPYRILLTIFGRWPFTHIENIDGTITYRLRWYHPQGIYFIITTIYFFYILLGGGYTFCKILLFLHSNQSNIIILRKINSTLLSKEFREGILVQRHMVLLISLWTDLFITVVTSISILWKSKFLINYFNFWTKAVQTMQMDLVRVSLKNSWLWVGSYLIVTIILFILAILQIGASSSGVPILMAIFTFKLFDEDLMIKTGLDPDYTNNTTIFTLYRIFGGIGFIYIFVCSKAYILLYLYNCKVLRNAFSSWNSRVYGAILKGGDIRQTQTKEERTTLELLFKDHCILLDLLEGANRLFGGVLESYFLLQITSLCFELYMILRTMRYGDKYFTAQNQGFFVREYDYIPITLIFILSISILYSVAKSCAFVGEEACAGIEVIRRKTMLGRKRNEEMYFMLNMYTSYVSHKKLELSAGGYFYMDKEFVITVVSTIISYFIIIYQFSPILDPKVSKFFSSERKMIGQFIVYTENGINCSWSSNSKFEALYSSSCE